SRLAPLARGRHAPLSHRGARRRPADLERVGHAGGGVPVPIAAVHAAGDLPVRLHLPDPVHAGRAPGADLRLPRPPFPPDPPRDHAQRDRPGPLPSRPRVPRSLLDCHLHDRLGAADAGGGLTVPAAVRILWRIVIKEFLQLRRDRKMIPALILGPLAQVLALGYAANTDVRLVPLVLVGQDRTSASRDLVRRFTESGWFRLAGAEDAPGRIEPWLVRGDAQVALVIGPGFGRAVELARTESPFWADRNAGLIPPAA